MSYETAAQTYERQRPKGGSPRETEGRALLEAARRMAEARTNPDDKKALTDVARLNWRLWTILQAEICAPNCALPNDMRANMLSLCNFVDKRIVDILADPRAQKFDALININRQIAAGLLSDADRQDTGPADNQDGGPAMGGHGRSV